VAPVPETSRHDYYEAGAMGWGGCDPARCRVLVRDVDGGPQDYIHALVHVTDGVAREVVYAVWDDVHVDSRTGARYVLSADESEQLFNRRAAAAEAAILATFPAHHAEHAPPIVPAPYDWSVTRDDDAAE